MFFNEVDALASHLVLSVRVWVCRKPSADRPLLTRANGVRYRPHIERRASV